MNENLYDVELKDCPFCGGKAYLREALNDENVKIYYIECSGCDLTVKNEYLPKGLIRKWNNRKSTIDENKFKKINILESFIQSHCDTTAIDILSNFASNYKGYENINLN